MRQENRPGVPNKRSSFFEFTDNGQTFRLPAEVQIVQLGGEALDTDYSDWWWANRKRQ